MALRAQQDYVFLYDLEGAQHILLLDAHLFLGLLRGQVLEAIILGLVHLDSHAIGVAGSVKIIWRLVRAILATGWSGSIGFIGLNALEVGLFELVEGVDRAHAVVARTTL